MKEQIKKVKIRIPKSIQKILLYVIGILMMLIVYVAVYQRTQLSNQDTKLRITQLETEESQLKAMKDNQKKNLKEIEVMTKEIKGILKEFPANVKEEDAILYATEIEESSQIKISDMTFTQRNLVFAGEKSEYSLYTTPVEYQFLSGYGDLKTMVDRFVSGEQVRNIQQITLTYDTETGLLRGTMLGNHYSVEGEQQKYQPKDNEQISIGNQNVFGTAN